MSRTRMAIVNRHIKEFFFTYYLLIAAIVFVLGVYFIVALSKAETIFGNLIPVIGATLGFLYFVQKQKIDETTLFEKLFTAFNKSYSELNKDLQAIRDGTLDPLKIRRVLDNYFNLCAEEYHFYHDGRIPQSVWRSWCLGMRDHMKVKPVADYFNEEVTAETHYGVTKKMIDDGAGCPD